MNKSNMCNTEKEKNSTAEIHDFQQAIENTGQSKDAQNSSPYKDVDLQPSRVQQTSSQFRRIELPSRASVGEGQATVKPENSGHKTSPAGRDGLVTASFPEGGGARGQQPVSGGGAASRAFVPTSQLCDMPTDALPTSSSTDSTGAPIKTERVSPGLEPSSLSPHSPSASKPFSSTGSTSCGVTLGARASSVSAVSPSPFSPPLSGVDCFSPTTALCGTPAIKQIEMMTRNYSDFMRSLAAKYNNQDIANSLNSSQSNGLVRNVNTTVACKNNSPYQCRTVEKSESSVKIEDHTSPSTGFEENITSPSFLSDFSSSQTLLSLVRTASAQSASQLENYLRGAVKRTVEGESRLDPLDLSLTTTKRSRTDSPISSLHDIHMCSPSARDIRDLYELLQVPFNAEGESSLNISSDSHSSQRTHKVPSWLALLDRRVRKNDILAHRTPTKGIVKHHCSSMCTYQPCSQKSDVCEISMWTVEDVVKFVTSIDSCSEYAEKFREQYIDGSTLPLLTEEHLTLHLGMKLGPALKLRSTVARKIGHCVVCMHCIHCHAVEQDNRNESSPSPSVSK